MFKKSNRANNQINKGNKQSNYFDFNAASNKTYKHAEMKRYDKTYYGIGKDRDTGKETLMDYQAKFRSEAEAYFDMEFHAKNADLTYVGVY